MIIEIEADYVGLRWQWVDALFTACTEEFHRRAVGPFWIVEFRERDGSIT